MGTMTGDATYSVLMHHRPFVKEKRASKAFVRERQEFWKPWINRAVKGRLEAARIAFFTCQSIEERLHEMIKMDLTKRTIRKHSLDDPFIDIRTWRRKLEPRLNYRVRRRGKFKKGFYYNPHTRKFADRKEIRKDRQ